MRFVPAHVFRCIRPALCRPGPLGLILTYLILSLVPFATLLSGGGVHNPGRLAAMELVAWIWIWAIFGRPAYFHWILLPAFLAVPVELYLNIYFNQGISSHHLGIIAETSPKEAMEFLGHKVWYLAAVLLAVLGWWRLTWSVARRTKILDWTDSSRWPTLVVLTLGAGTWLYGQQYGVQSASAVTEPMTSKSAHLQIASLAQSPPGHSAPKLPAWAAIPFDAEAFGGTWPFGLVVRGYEFWKERSYLAELQKKNRQFSFGARQTNWADVPQVIVMVIGESSRYDRWSLNGYARETNPLLKKEENLVSLANVVTAVSATRLSVPVLMSRKPATQSLRSGFAEKSFLTAFKEAGFKTYWLSNQMSFGQFDTPISVFAQEADVTEFLNLGGFTNYSSYDEVLLGPLEAAIADPAKKKLIVLHTLGSHWNFSHRYPRDFDNWQPSLYGVENPAYTERALKQQLNNSYDNSVLYTDWLLSQVINKLERSRQLAAMMYVADHGQALYDGTCKLAFHGHNTQYEFHVPALVWYSDLYRITQPAKVVQLQKNQRAKLTTENIFHSLLDLADIHYRGEQLDRSFMSEAFLPHKRYVDSYGWSDYDNATFKGDCREVIDKGRPLLKEK